MARVIWKDVLHPGRCRDRDGRDVAVSRRDVADAEANARLALARGFPVPGVWEHQDLEAKHAPGSAAAAAEWKRRYAKFCFGHMTNVRRDADGVLWMAFEVPGGRDAEQLAKCRFVSPKLYHGYADPRGGTYGGLFVAHVAATPSPCQFWQEPFALSAAPDPGGDDLGPLIAALRGYGVPVPEGARTAGDLAAAVRAATGRRNRPPRPTGPVLLSRAEPPGGPAADDVIAYQEQLAKQHSASGGNRK